MTTIEEESMATTTDEKDTTTVSINGGKEFPLDQLDQHGEEIAEAAGLQRRQLSFDVGGREPNRTSLKTSVDILIPRELRKGSEIRIAVTGPDGELLAQTRGKVVGVTFEDEYKDGFIVGSERVHKVKLGI